MFWKIIIKLFRCHKKDYIQAIQIKNEIYIVEIKRFIPAEEELQKWKNALKNKRTPKWEQIEKRVTALEKKVQEQSQDVNLDGINHYLRKDLEERLSQIFDSVPDKC